MKKRIFTGVMTVAVAFTLLLPIMSGMKVVFAKDNEIQSGDWKYEILEDENIELIAYSGTEAELVVPSQIDGYTVASLGTGAFSGCDFLKSIQIPASVNNIESDIFEMCYGLTTITVDESNSKYDSRDNCNAIIETKNNTLMFGCKGTIIPDSVTSIGKYSFADCVGLRNIEIPDSVTNIGKGAFYDCCDLISIQIPEGVISLSDYTFGNCMNLEKITIPNSVESIGKYTFLRCDKLVIYSSKDSYAYQYAIENKIEWLDINTFPIKVENFTYTARSSTAILFEWTKDENASGYEIEQYKDEKWVVIADVLNEGSLSYKVKDLIPSTSNEFRIRAYKNDENNKYYSEYAELTVSTLPSQVTGFTYSSRSSSSVALKWDMNKSANGYVVEMYRNGKWVKIINISMGSTSSCAVAALSPSTTYKFRIKAYNTLEGKALYGNNYTSKSVNTLPTGVKNFTYSARSSSAVLLKWEKNTSATGYLIEQYKNGKWVKIKNLTKNTIVSYKVTGLSASTNNKFRIKAYKTFGTANLYSGAVAKSVNTLPSNVAGFTYSTRTKNTISLKWNKNTSASGYVIEQYKNGKWVKIKTISKNSTVSYKVTGLKKATSYKFRIKAYKAYGGSNLYSGYISKMFKTI